MRPPAMMLLVCELCAASHYSASAAVLVEHGATCENCGGRLLLHEAEAVAPTGPETQSGRPWRPD